MQNKSDVSPDSRLSPLRLTIDELLTADLNDLYSYFFFDNAAKNWATLSPSQFDYVSGQLIARCVSLNASVMQISARLKLAIWLFFPTISLLLKTTVFGALIGISLAAAGHWFINRLIQHRGHEVGYLRWLSALYPLTPTELNGAFPNIRTRAQRIARGRELVYGDVIAASMIENPAESKDLRTAFMKTLDRA